MQVAEDAWEQGFERREERECRDEAEEISSGERGERGGTDGEGEARVLGELEDARVEGSLVDAFAGVANVAAGCTPLIELEED